MTSNLQNPSLDNPSSNTPSSNEMTTQEIIQALLSPERVQRTDMFTILVLSDLNDRDTVAEIGCGPGFFTIPLAKAPRHLSSGRLL